MSMVEEKARKMADERIIELLAPLPKHETPLRNPLELIFGGAKQQESPAPNETDQLARRVEFERESLREKLARGEMENEYVEIEVEKIPLLCLRFLPALVWKKWASISRICWEVCSRKKEKKARQRF
jgi:ATP-dependent HslUV protease ATP-binding subunit HslU